jgi:hypothetical protein
VAGTLHPWTVGIEEEKMLLDRRNWSVANRIELVGLLSITDVRRLLDHQPRG